MRFSGVRLYFFVAAILPLLFLPCPAQETGGDFSISGTVVNFVTGEPVRQALIKTSGEAEGDESGSRDINIEPVLTDPGGTFHIRGLRAATYYVRAEKPRFSEADTESEFKLGPSREGIRIRLSPLNSISGKVLDGDGEPVADLAIRVLRAGIQNGRRELRLSKWASTDDLGRYHLSNLDPGTYYILAAGRSSERVADAERHQLVAGSHEGFGPVYFPSAAQRTSAVPVTMAAGEVFEANLQVLMQPAFRIHGTLRSYDPKQEVITHTFRVGVGAIAARATITMAAGLRSAISCLARTSFAPPRAHERPRCAPSGKCESAAPTSRASRWIWRRG